MKCSEEEEREMGQSLYGLLHDCIEQVVVPKKSQGTGFFVAPGLVLTCAHVVEAAQEGNLPIQVSWHDQTFLAHIQEYRDSKYPDLALLKVNLSNHPCVLLHEGAEPFSELYSFGYPDLDPRGASTTFETEGWAGDKQELLKFKEGQVRPGMSGSPLLNRVTGSVCGIVQFTRDRSTDLGGKGMLTKVVLREFPELEEQQKLFHQRDKRWLDCLTPQQREVLGMGSSTSQSGSNNTIEVFFSYADSDKDKDMLTELLKQMSILKRLNYITDWHEGMLTPTAGEEPDEQVMQHLNSARIIVLLISPDYMYSEKLNTVHVERAMERHRSGEATVIPVLLRSIDNWKEAPFGKLLAIPRSGKPINKWQDRDEAFAEVAKEIRTVVTNLRGQP
jgi:trypsin-like peptidase/TIR domain-containing protein